MAQDKRAKTHDQFEALRRMNAMLLRVARELCVEVEAMARQNAYNQLAGQVRVRIRVRVRVRVRIRVRVRARGWGWD